MRDQDLAMVVQRPCGVLVLKRVDQRATDPDRPSCARRVPVILVNASPCAPLRRQRHRGLERAVRRLVRGNTGDYHPQPNR